MALVVFVIVKLRQNKSKQTNANQEQQPNGEGGHYQEIAMDRIAKPITNNH